MAGRALMLDDVALLHGAEGEGALAVFDRLQRTPGPDFAFTTRSRRPPLDRINAVQRHRS